jgi:hypothetical protein
MKHHRQRFRDVDVVARKIQKMFWRHGRRTGRGGNRATAREDPMFMISMPKTFQVWHGRISVSLWENLLFRKHI